MVKTIWLVKDDEDQLVDLCEDEITAFAVKQSYDKDYYTDCSITEIPVTTREDVKSLFVFTPEDEGADILEFKLEREKYDA